MTTKTFTAKAASGSVDLSFKIDPRRLKGDAAVAFEELRDERTVKLAEHKDLNDKSQTVTVAGSSKPVPVGTPSEGAYAKTGSSLWPVVCVTLLLIAATFGSLAVAANERKRKRKETE